MVCSRLNKQTAGQREHWDKPETDVSKPARARDNRAHQYTVRMMVEREMLASQPGPETTGPANTLYV